MKSFEDALNAVRAAGVAITPAVIELVSTSECGFSDFVAEDIKHELSAISGIKVKKFGDEYQMGLEDWGITFAYPKVKTIYGSIRFENIEIAYKRYRTCVEQGFVKY